MIILTAYIAMLIFDLSVLAGFIWCVENGWSPEWVILVIIVIGSSNPSSVRKVLLGEPEEKKKI